MSAGENQMIDAPRHRVIGVWFPDHNGRGQLRKAYWRGDCWVIADDHGYDLVDDDELTGWEEWPDNAA